MLIYKVTGSPVLVRQSPSCDARVINVVGPNKLIYTVSEDCGWLRTSAGNYVFKTDDITLDNDPAHYQETIPKITFKSARLLGETNHYADEQYDGPTIGDDPESPDLSDIIATSSDKVSGDTAKQQETNQNEPTTNAAGNNTGNEVQAVDKNAVIYTTDANGNRIQVSAESAKITEAHNGSIIIEYPNESNGNMVVFQGSDGKTYYAEGSQVKEGSATVSGITYNDFERRELEEERRQAQMINEELQLLRARTAEGYRQAVLNVKDGDIRHIFGMPYQFLPTADLRPNENVKMSAGDIKAFGRKYAEKISSRAPIMIMQPGEAIFLRGYSEDVKSTVAKGLTGLTGDQELTKVVNGNGGEYYSFKLASSEYYYTVNSACRAVATFLGLDNVSVPSINSITDKDNSVAGEVFKSAGGNSLGGFNWAFNSTFSLASYYHGAVQFYINSEAQVQENIGTQTRQSQLAGQINGISDKAMEAMFIMGGVQSSLIDMTGAGAGTDTKAATGKLSGDDSSIGTGKGLFNSIVGNITSLLAGGRMYFPEIWSDSQFGRSYNVTIKLDSPDCDPLSIYLNILVPLIHIMGFCLPRCAGDNTYISPFLVRAFYKSMFHIDMGMVTSCDIVKGDQGCWTQDGLPTQITVQLSIKDLYSVMTQAMGKSTNTILSNPAQLDYLANLCGINIAPANLGRTLELWWMLKGTNRLQDAIVSVPTDIVKNVWSRVQNIWEVRRRQM